jgi:aspartyl-tRNA(Asn)/glutamyl-tRNA(Gln) amidotransferase subunit A
MGPVAIAADGGGSIRIPASFCGLFGMKASMGRVPMYPSCRDERYPGIASWEGLEHVGPVSRTVADSALVLSVIAGPDPRDRHSIPAGDVDWRAAAEPGELRGLRVAYSPDLGRVAVDDEVRRVVDSGVGAFAELGAEVVEDDPHFPDPGAAFAALIALESDLTGMRELIARHGHEMSPHLVDLISREWRAEDFTDALTVRKAVVNAMWRFMRRYDLLLTPTLTTPPFPVHVQGPEKVGGRYVRDTAWLSFTSPFNLTGQPAATVPAGFTANGLPVGLQVVGGHLADGLVLRAAAAFEAARPWAQHRPPLDDAA